MFFTRSLLAFCALLLNLCYLGLNIELVVNPLSVPRIIWFSLSSFIKLLLTTSFRQGLLIKNVQ